MPARSVFRLVPILGLLLAGLIQGVPREEVLHPDWPPLPELQALRPLHAEVADVAAGSFRRKQPPDIQGSGYVVHSLEAALVGLSRRGRLSRSRPAGSQPGRRCRHDRRGLRPTRRGVLWRERHSLIIGGSDWAGTH